MAKDINIHVKTRGTAETKRQLDSVGQSVDKAGSSTEQMGQKAERSSNWFTGAIRKMIGPLGLAALTGSLAAAAFKVAGFFDTLNQRCDAAVEKVRQMRAGYDGLFEAMDAYDEKSRMQVTASVNALLQQARVPAQVGLPVIEAYTRQFGALVGAGAVTQQQYDTGLREMLGYAARHGGPATADLISIAAGWRITAPDQQGVLRRQVAAAAQASGLTDEQLITALSRGMPTIKAMGWTPQQAIEAVAVIASGEAGRKRVSLPGTTFQALMAPQPGGIEAYGISPEIADDPRRLLAELTARRDTMDRQAFTRMLVKIYGTEAAAGAFKLVAEPRQAIRGALIEAAGEAGRQGEEAEQKRYETTLEATTAATEAARRQISLDLTEDEKYMEQVRQIGKEYQEVLRRREPEKQWLYEHVPLITPTIEQEEAAYRLWRGKLTEEERAAIKDPRRWKRSQDQAFAFQLTWQRMTPRQKLAALQGDHIPTFRGAGASGTREDQPIELSPPPPAEQQAPAEPVKITYHYDNRRIFNPVVGRSADDIYAGARAPRMVT